MTVVTDDRVGGSARMAWLDVAKGIAMIGVLGVHAVERAMGGPWWSNPAHDWPAFGDRVEQWRPTGGSFWAVVANPVRWLGWLGDLAPSLFVFATGFLLVTAGARPGGYGAQVLRRLRGFLPMYWLALVGVTVLAALAGAENPSPRHGAFWLSFLGFRATPGTVYYGAGAWWYVGFLVQLAFVAPLLARWLAPGRAGVRRAAVLLGAAVVVKAAALGLLAGTAEIDPVNRGGVLIGKLPELLAGMLLALVAHGAADARAEVRRLVPWGAVALSLALGFASAFTLLGNAVAGVLVALGVVGLCAHLVDRGTRPASRALRFVSRHSLAIFLAHPVPNKIAGGAAFGPVMAVRIAVAMALGVVAGLALERAYAWSMARVPRRPTLAV